MGRARMALAAQAAGGQWMPVYDEDGELMVGRRWEPYQPSKWDIEALRRFPNPS
jgi:hypothetical protein